MKMKSRRDISIPHLRGVRGVCFKISSTHDVQSDTPLKGGIGVRSLLIVFLLALNPSIAQTLQQRDPTISAMINEISAQNIESNIRALANFQTRHSLSDTTSNQAGIGAARRWIKAELERYSKAAGGKLKVEFDPFVVEADGRRIPQRVEMRNVLARLPGSDPSDNRVLIVSGHYDSRASDPLDAKSAAPGANDDASGTAVIMELARVMSKRAFSATIIFVAVAGEEQGLYGAAHLAQRAQNEKWNVIAMITNDIVGNTLSSETNLRDNAHVRVFSEGVPATENEAGARLRQSVGSENDGPARQFARYLKEVSERYVDHMNVTLIYRRDRFLRGGDHTPFSRLGFTAVRLTEMNEDFTHQHQNVRSENDVQYGDLPEFVDYAYVAQVARVNLAGLANLASAPAAPDSVFILTKELTNKTTLRWRRSAIGKAPASYRILMRETTSAYWRSKFEVGNVTTHTLPYSKDNFIFAVQAVNANGHESLPVFPAPAQ